MFRTSPPNSQLSSEARQVTQQFTRARQLRPTNMFLTLLLIAPALCEWVEISQHHARKPTKTYNFRPIEKATERYFEETTAKMYPNQSMTSTPWSRGNINKVPKLGNVQRVQLDDSHIKAPSLSVNPVRNYLNVGPKIVNKIDIKQSESVNSDFIETKRHVGAENGRYKTTNKLSTPNIEKMHTQLVSNTKQIFAETTNEDNKTKTSLSNINNRPSNELDLISNKPGLRYQNIDGVLGDLNIPVNKQKSNVTLRPQIFGFDLDKSNRKSSFITDLETTNNSRNDFKFPSANADKKFGAKIISTEKGYDLRNKHTQNANLGTKGTDFHPKREDNNTDIRGSIIQSKLTNHEFVTKMEIPVDDEMDATVSNDDEDPYIANPAKPENQNSIKENFSQEDEVETSSKNKVNSFDNLMTFMKIVAETISKNTRRSVNSKTRYLSNLKNTILANIAERIDAAWPDDEPDRRLRMTRDAHASLRGHLEIPSSESALMTISFLTFAVFLIKLVLQVIQTYKNKAMMMTPAVVAVGRAATKRNSKS